jgi:hypothetical protein
VQYQEEPAAISNGANEPEALDNITDALELCLEHEKELQTRKAQGGMSYTAKQLVKAAKKLGFQVKEGARHTLIYDPVRPTHIYHIFLHGDRDRQGDPLGPFLLVYIIRTVAGGGAWMIKKLVGTL